MSESWGVFVRMEECRGKEGVPYCFLPIAAQMDDVPVDIVLSMACESLTIGAQDHHPGMRLEPSDHRLRWLSGNRELESGDRTKA